MPIPLATPRDTSDRIAELLLHLETHIAPSLTLTPLAVRRMGGGVDAMVMVSTTDRRREALTAAEARTMSACLRFDTPLGLAHARWALDLHAAADLAERQAFAAAAAHGGAAIVSRPRAFGAAR